MTPAETRKRVLRALERGPLYIGALPLIVGAAPAQVEAAVRELRRQRRVTRDAAGTVALEKVAHAG